MFGWRCIAIRIYKSVTSRIKGWCGAEEDRECQAHPASMPSKTPLAYPLALPIPT